MINVVSRKAGEKEHHKMKTYHLDANNRIKLIEAGKHRNRDGQFCSEEQWVKMAADLPMARLVAIWNHLPGVTKVERFTSRAKAIQRIWNVLITGIRPVAQRKPVRQPPGGTRESKKEQLLALLRQPDGVSLDSLVSATGWQKHSIRGFLSGAVRRTMGLKLVSSKDTSGTRVYRIEA